MIDALPLTTVLENKKRHRTEEIVGSKAATSGNRETETRGKVTNLGLAQVPWLVRSCS